MMYFAANNQAPN